MVTKKVLNLFKPLSKALVRFSAVKKTAAPFAFGALLVIVPVALLVMKNAQPVSAAWYDSGWHFRKKIVINRTQVAGTFDLVNFPFLLTKIDLDVRTYSQEDGGDIMFADSGGTKLDHELQMFDFASGKIVAWVKIPVLSVTKDTELYMYYGNVNSADQENPAGVWADGFTGVWHLEDSPLDTPQVMDSTGSDIHGIYSQSMSASNQVDGVIGDAVDFAGAEDYVNFASSSGQVQTLEFWTKPADLTSFFINLSDEPKYVWADTGQVQLAGEPAAQVYVNGGAGGAIKAGVWNHVAVTASAQTLTKLQFGLVRSTDYYSGDYYSGDYYSGVLDEIRISNVVRSPDWLKTSYINQQDPSAFMTFSAQDRGPNSPASPTLFWRFNEAGGTTANDASSYANTGTLAASTATPTWNTTSFVGGGASLYFDGSNDYVSKSYSSDTELNPGTASMSVDLWFNHPSAIAGTDTLISRASGTLASEVGYKIYMTSSGYMCFGIDDTAGSFPEDNACSTTSYADSSWHHLEVTKDGITSITLYIDGLQVATNTNTGSDATISGTNPAFYVGVDSDGASNPWTGFIDEVRVYDVLRSASDVKTDYAARGATRGTGVSFGGSQINEKLSKGLAGYWKMDEGAADSCSGTEDNCDSSGTSAHGVWNNNSTFAGGKFGNAVSNDGTGDYVSVADNTAHEPSSITISSWIYWTGIGDNWLISKQSAFDSYTNGYLMRADTPTNTVWCKFGNGSTVDTPTVAVATGAWYHMVCTYDNGVARIYQNGSLIGTTTGTATGLTYTSVGDLTFGGHSGSTGLTINGKMDEVRIYNRALAASEITSLYNWEPGPVGYWKFDENSGSTALDVSGNGKDLSLTSVTYNTGKYGSSTAFNGSTSTSSVTDGPSLSLTNTGTLEAWVYSNRAYPSDDGTTKYRNIINKWTAGACSGADEGYLFDWYGTSSAATLRGWVCNGTTAQGITYSTTLTANAWTHVAYVWDGSYHRLYMNGVQVGTPASQTINNQDDTGTLRVGDGFGGGSIYRWDGRLDEARVYNYARTSDQIVEDMNAGHPTGGSPVASQVGYWKFDDGYGSTAQDSSPNNLDLTLYYSPTWTNSGKFNKALDMEKNSFNYASAADSTALSITGSLTLSSWLNPESVTASTEFPIAGKWSSSGKSYLLAQYGDEIRMYIDSASNYVTTDAANLAAGTWYYVAGVYNSTAQTVTIYINGVAYTATTTGTIPSSIGDDTDAFVVGTDQLPTTMSTISVSASLDDGFDVAGSGTFTGTETSVYTGGKDVSGNVRTTGFRFQTVAVPKDATIISALLDFREGWGGDYGTSVKNRIYGELSADCLTFGDSSLPRNRTKTSAYVDWDSAGSQGAAGDWYQTSANAKPGSVVSIVDEINSQASWASGNDLCIIITDDGSTNDWWFEPRSYEYSWTTANSARLNISYGGAFYDGVIDEVKLYNSALSQEDILLDMNQGKAISLGTVSNKSGSSTQAASQEYCVSGDTATCTGPILEWKLDENTGTSTVYDTSGSGYTGTMNGTMTAGDWIPGKKGTGLDLDGTDDNVTRTFTSDLFGASGSDATLSYWLKNRDTGATERASLELESTLDPQFRARKTGAATSDVVYQNSSDVDTNLSFATNINDGSWHSISIVISGTNITLYVDGKKDATAADFSQLYTLGGITGLYFGSDQYGNDYQGIIDDLRVFTYARSPAQIAWDFSRGKAQWQLKLDQSSGSTAYDSGAMATNGTLQNNAAFDTTAGNCKFSYCVDLDGTNDYISTGSFSPLAVAALATDTISWGGWYYLTSTSGTASRVLFEKASELKISTNADSKPLCQIYTGGAYAPASPSNLPQAITTDTWYNVFCIYDGANVKTYINGQLAATNSQAGSVTAVSSAAYVGVDSGQNGDVSGRVDDQYVFNFTLTSSQILDLYNSQSGVSFR